MILEIVISGVIVWIIFGDYVAARAEEISENARKIRLENDEKEYPSES
jgi:hypothetical protein